MNTACPEMALFYMSAEIICMLFAAAIPSFATVHLSRILLVKPPLLHRGEKQNGPYGDRTRDLGVISTTL